ncbi:MAG: glutaredoxin family protein [Verrucomicrobiae bacterium]|nr:glutaredoxin family protein [Verrucomicrobiae bacterium]MCX7722047.1 glutaredoxin family protein [Verrucomicrobiae bacterium]MDW7979526.1 glutaredoxin family protein [Verrucomicrobiales bacterium]
MQPKQVKLYIKPYCPWCKMAMEWLNKHGVTYTAIDVIADPGAFEEMVKLSGQTRAPVIDVDGKVLADFGPDELEQFWNKLTSGRG